MIEAKCVKCRAKKVMKNAKAVTMKNGKQASQGTCPTWSTKMFRNRKGQIGLFVSGIQNGVGDLRCSGAVFFIIITRFSECNIPSFCYPTI